jgi:hypothetical protein
MADVITRFKLETTQYDSKLRDASKSLAEYTRKATQAGNEFGKFTQNSVEAARAIGNIAPSATNAKDKVKELVGAFNDAARAYNALTKEQQQSDFGKAMAESIGQLSQQIKEAKDELYGLSDAVKGKGGGLFGEGGLTGMLQVAGGNLLSNGISALAGGLKDAWTQSIELAKAGEGVRIAFERLNQPGLLDRLKEATHGTVSEVELMKQAIQFENFKLPLEDLATYLAFAQQKAKDTGQSIDYLVNSIVTGLGRQSKQILDNLGISASELTRRMNEGADMTKAVADIIREEMGKAGDYVETAADRAAKAAADAANEMEAFGRQAAPIAEQWGQTWNALSIGAMDFASTLLGPVADSIRSIQNILVTTLDDRRIAMFEAFDKLSKQQQAQSGYKGMGNAQMVTTTGGYVEVTDSHTGEVIGGKHFDNTNDLNAIKDWRKSLFKKSGGSNKKTGKTETVYAEGSIAAQSKIVSDLTKKWNEAGEDMRTGYLYQLIEAENKLKSMKDEQKALRDMTTWGELKGAPVTGLGESSFSGKSLKDLQGVKLELKLPKEKSEASLTKEIGSMAGGISQMVGSMEALGIELPEGMKDVVNGVTSLISIVSGIATIVTAIEALNAADTIIPFAHGGVVHAANGFVQGNNYSGDMIPAALNAGELVLNKAQQGNLASQLQGAGLGGVNMVGEISGEAIKIVLNRHLKRSGQGEIVTW